MVNELVLLANDKTEDITPSLHFDKGSLVSLWVRIESLESHRLTRQALSSH